MTDPSFTVEKRDAADGPPSNISPATLLWTDPPFGTGKRQTQGENSYFDAADVNQTCINITRWIPCLSEDATIVICCDYRLAAKITTTIVDEGWKYRGEIIWTFGLGRPRNSWWPVRHNNILTFTKTERSGIFNADAIPREPRLAPKAGYPDDKAAGSVWQHTMSNTDPERVGYPNQKPLAIVEPFIQAHTNDGDLVVDPYCGSGTTAVATLRNNRNFYGCDINPQAITTTINRINHDN